MPRSPRLPSRRPYSLAPLAATAAIAAAIAAPTASARVPAVPTGTVSHASTVATPVSVFAVRGGGFRARPRISPNRPLNRNRAVRSRNTSRALRSFTRTLLQALGIAFLLNLLFGIGPGGSPLGLLLLLGLIALVVASRRRRRLRYR